MELFKREKYLSRIRGFYDADDLIKVITGVRRCGKSSLMRTIMEELRARGVREENLLFFDLDQRQYSNVRTADQLDRLIEENAAADGMKYLFLDEVQNVVGFEEVLNGFRAEGGWSVFITGSNSYLLSGEITTRLTGRYLSFELFPLSFEEYEGMKRYYGKKIDPNPLAELNDYMDTAEAMVKYIISTVLERCPQEMEFFNAFVDKGLLTRLHNVVSNEFGRITYTEAVKLLKVKAAGN